MVNFKKTQNHIVSKKEGLFLEEGPLAIISLTRDVKMSAEFFAEFEKNFNEKAEKRNYELPVVSSGMPGAEHIAVRAFLSEKTPSLKLYLPADFKDGKFVEDSSSKINEGRIANGRHEQFRQASGVNSLDEIQSAILAGAKIEVFDGLDNARRKMIHDAEQVFALDNNPEELIAHDTLRASRAVLMTRDKSLIQFTPEGIEREKNHHQKPRIMTGLIKEINSTFDMYGNQKVYFYIQEKDKKDLSRAYINDDKSDGLSLGKRFSKEYHARCDEAGKAHPDQYIQPGKNSEFPISLEGKWTKKSWTNTKGEKQQSWEMQVSKWTFGSIENTLAKTSNKKEPQR